jgi:hypothetical protein
MVSRSNEGPEAPHPASRTPGAPAKGRLTRLGSSPSKRDDKTKDDRMGKTSAKDVAELKDYVCPVPALSSRLSKLTVIFEAIG